MPLPLPRAPLRSLSTSLLSSTTSSITTPTTLRTFTTSPRHDVELPPESPRFINQPPQPQSSEERRPPVKGVLPVPREIFTKRTNMRHKLEASFVDHTVPKSKREVEGLPPKSEKDAWKRSMAESRRQALASGIDSLWKRKQSREFISKSRAERHRLRNAADASAPEALDDVLTRGTVTQATLSTAVIRDPHYAEKQRESAKRTAALAEFKSEARKDALQRLYVEAGRFIVSEESLAKKVEEIFTETHFRAQGRSRALINAQNTWEGYGPPIRMKDMFADMNGTSNSALSLLEEDATRTTKRQKIVSGALAGSAVDTTDGRPRRA